MDRSALELRAAGRRCGAGVLWGKRRHGARAGRTGSGDGSARMAAVVAMTAAGCAGAGAARSLSRFRGCLAGALLGDCVGAMYEAHDTVNLTSVLRHVQSLEPDPGSPGSERSGGQGQAHVGTRGRGSPARDPGLRGARWGEACVRRPGCLGRPGADLMPAGSSGSARLSPAFPNSDHGNTILPAVEARNLGVILLNCA